MSHQYPAPGMDIIPGVRNVAESGLFLFSLSIEAACLKAYSHVLRKPSPRPGYTCIAGLEDIAITENGIDI